MEHEMLTFLFSLCLLAGKLFYLGLLYVLIDYMHPDFWRTLLYGAGSVLLLLFILSTMEESIKNWPQRKG